MVDNFLPASSLARGPFAAAAPLAVSGARSPDSLPSAPPAAVESGLGPSAGAALGVANSGRGSMAAAVVSSARTSAVGSAVSPPGGATDRSLPAGSAPVSSVQPRQVRHAKAMSVHDTRLITQEVHTTLHPQSPAQPSVCSIRACWAPTWPCNHPGLVEVWVAAKEDAWLPKPMAAVS